MKKKTPFGELEMAILNILRTSNRATVHEVCKALEGGRKYTTIMTVMQRLFEKEELCRERIGRHYEYWIDQSNQSNQGLLKRLKEKIFSGRSIDMMSYLLETDEEITSYELDELEMLIEKKRAKE